MEDPYFIVKGDIEKSLLNLSNLYERFLHLKSSKGDLTELSDVQTDIKTGLRDVQYDIEDIEETVRIVEDNPSKFKISGADIAERRAFISETKAKLSGIKTGVSGTDYRHGSASNGSKSSTKNFQGAKYSKLEAYQEEQNDKFVASTMHEQQKLIERQDEQVDLVAGSIGVLKQMSKQIGTELDDQADKLDMLHHETESMHAKMNNVMNKLAKVTRLSNDKRQWTAIIFLLVVVIILFLVLVLL